MHKYVPGMQRGGGGWHRTSVYGGQWVRKSEGQRVRDQGRFHVGRRQDAARSL